MPLLPVLPVISSFMLNELVSALSAVQSAVAPLSSTAGLFLQYFDKIPDYFE